jgi:hypothetical protein
MASVCGSSTTGSNVALFQRRSENQMRHTPLESTTSPIDGCEIGSRTQVVSTRHPQRKLYEVHYARCVGMPSGRSPPPFGFGITRRTGLGRYVFETNSLRKPSSHASRPDASIAAKGHLVHPRRARVAAGQHIGVVQDVFSADLVVKHVEAKGGLRLRFAIELL